MKQDAAGRKAGQTQGSRRMTGWEEVETGGVGCQPAETQSRRVPSGGRARGTLWNLDSGVTCPLAS